MDQDEKLPSYDQATMNVAVAQTNYEQAIKARNNAGERLDEAKAALVKAQEDLRLVVDARVKQQRGA